MFAFGASTPSGPARSQQLDFRIRTLANGLRVITLEDFAWPVVAVHVWYHVGAVNEDPARQGFAHLFEHMMFRGTDRLGPKDHFELINRSGGDSNGYTSFDQTVYTNFVPSNQVSLALWLEAERMALLRIDEDGFRTERQVVEEERRLGLNRPYGTVFEKLLPAVFPRHPYRWTPIGRIPHLRAASVAEVRSFWLRYYVPNNATLVIVGAARHAEAQRLAEQYFSWIPRGQAPGIPGSPIAVDRDWGPPPGDSSQPPADDPPARPKPASAGEGQARSRELTIEEPTGPVPIVGLACRTVPIWHPDHMALEFLAQVLGGGRSSRLHRDLVRQKKLAVSTDVIPFAFQHGGMFCVQATLRPDGDKAETLAQLRRHVRRLTAEPVTETEWTKARNQLLHDEVVEALTCAGKAELLGRYAVTFDDPDRVNRRLDEVQAVTAGDALRVAQAYFAADRLLSVIVEPTPGRGPQSRSMAMGDPRQTADADPQDASSVQAAAPAAASLPDAEPPSRAVPARPAGFPADPPARPLTEQVPRIDHGSTVLANGLKVVVVPDSRAPFLRMTLGLKYGAWTEDPRRPGAAWTACRMLTRGTDHYTAEQLAEQLEMHAIVLEGTASMDVAEIHADCLSVHADRAAELLAEAVLRPTFPSAEFDLLRTQTVNRLLVRARAPDYVADREFRERLFDGFPYARTPTGEPDDLERLNGSDFSAWWRRFARPDAAVLYIAGDMAPAAGFRLAERWLGGWQAPVGPAPEPTLADIPAPGETHVYVVDRPDVVQSEIRLGHVGITRSHPDYFAARVLTHIFGGAFNSRLMQSLRISKGLTYGIGGSFRPERFAGTFRIRTFTQTARTAEAVRAILDELEVLRTTRPTDDELSVAKSYLIGSFVGARETPQATVNDLWLIEYAGLPADYLARYLAGIRATDGADVSRVARELVYPQRLTVVVVGDAAAVKDDLAQFAPVTVVTR